VTTSDEVCAALASGSPIMNQMMEPTVPASTAL
jgi:hypothetical protein